MVFTQSKLMVVAALVGLGACTDEAEPREPQVQEQAQQPRQGNDDDSTRPPQPAPLARDGSGNSNLVGTGPIAYGTILDSGAKYSGTANWFSTYNALYQRYEITIAGESYYYLNYATVVTPAGDIRFCRTSSVGGKLLIYCYDHAGNPATSRIGFVTSEP